MTAATLSMVRHVPLGSEADGGGPAEGAPDRESWRFRKVAIGYTEYNLENRLTVHQSDLCIESDDE